MSRLQNAKTSEQLSVFHIVRYAKMYENTSYRETNRHYFQCFSAVYAQNAKMNGKQSILEHKTKLPKTCLLSIFYLTYYNAKTHAKYNGETETE